MGCSASFDLINHFDEPKYLKAEKAIIFSDCVRNIDVSVIMEKDIDIIKDQWPRLSNDLTGNGTEVFVNIFKAHPDAKKLFHCENVPESKLSTNLVVRQQGVRFMKFIGRTVNNLEDLDNSVSKACLFLGKRHYRYSGFKPVYFEAYYDAFFKVYHRVLGSNSCHETAVAWSHLLQFILEQLKKGYHLASIEAVTEGAIRKASEIESKILNKKKSRVLKTLEDI